MGTRAAPPFANLNKIDKMLQNAAKAGTKSLFYYFKRFTKSCVEPG